MMTPRIVIAYRTILERALDLEVEANQRNGQMSSSFYGQTAAGLRTGMSVIEGVCNDDPELLTQLKDISNELTMEDGGKNDE